MIMKTKNSMPFISYLRILKTIIIVLLINNVIISQSHFKGFSISMKGGASFSAGSIGSSGSFKFNYLPKDYVFSFEYMDDVELDYDLKFGTSVSKYYSIMGGKYFDNKALRFTLQAGLNYIKSETNDTYFFPKDEFPFIETIKTSDYREGFGVLGNFEVDWVLSRYFSLGIDFNLNINKIKTNVIPCISIEAGILRPKKQKQVTQL